MRDLSQLVSWHSDWKELRVVVFGLGVTGFSVADTLAELGCEVLVLAEKADAQLVEILDVIGVKHVIGVGADQSFAEVDAFKPDLLITSPGVKPEHELLQRAKQAGVPIWVDIDLAWRLRDKTGKVAKWIAVTGTNGKTTTVQLASAMLNQGGLRTIACGNIGTPILDAIRDPEGFDVLVIELSSFQLHYLGEIHPHASVVLNLADDHLDWHGGFEAYRDTKAKIYENTEIACVYNVQDLVTEKMVENAEVHEGARAIGFTTGMPSISQVGFVEDILCDRAFIDNRQNAAQELATDEDIAEIGVVTNHLKANIAAASALARSIGVSPADIRDALRTFELDHHRIELIADHDGVRWIDDSKATNPHAAAASLSSFDSVIWVVGGLLKGVVLDDLITRFAKNLKTAIVIGAERAEVLAALARAASSVPVIEITSKEVMREVVASAKAIVGAGDTVLLAPAAASMDQFKDYADRGEQFALQVREQLGI